MSINKKSFISRRDFLVSVGIVGASLALGACNLKTSTKTSGSLSQNSTSNIAPTSSGPKYGGTLKIVHSSPMGTIGYPTELVMGGAATSSSVVLEGLLREKLSGELVPTLAESYKVADDRKSVTFYLRKGVTFHDGSSFNAEVAKWNLDNVIEAKTEPYWKSIDVIDEYTIRVDFTQWRNSLIGDFGDNPATYMISKSAFDKNGIDWVRQHPIGTTAFKFVSFERDSKFVTQKYTNYWGRNTQGNILPYLDGVEIVYIQDPVTVQMVMQSGQVDILGPGLESAKDVSKLKAAGINITSTMTATLLIIPDSANSDSPWSKQQVREAAEYAIDREAIARAFGYGIAQAAYQIIGRDHAVYQPNYALARKYDIDKAKQLMIDASYPQGFDTSIVGSPVGVNRDIVAAIQNDLSKIGIKANLQYPDFGKYMLDYWAGLWHNGLVVTSLPAANPNVNAVLNMALSQELGTYKSWLRTPEYIKAFNTSISSPTVDINLEHEIINTISKQASLIPVIEWGDNAAYQSYVIGADIGSTIILGWSPELTWLNK